MKYLGKRATKAKPRKCVDCGPPLTRVEIKFVTYLRKSILNKGLMEILEVTKSISKGEKDVVS